MIPQLFKKTIFCSNILNYIYKCFLKPDYYWDIGNYKSFYFLNKDRMQKILKYKMVKFLTEIYI